MVNADREEDAVKNDSMISYETVKYFNAEHYEFNRYRNAVNKFQVSVQKHTLKSKSKLPYPVTEQKSVQKPYGTLPRILINLL